MLSFLLLHAMTASRLVTAEADSCATDRLVDVPTHAASRLVIPPPTEVGTPLVVRGRVVRATGAPVSGALIYVYHANAAGKYPKRPGLCGAARLQGYLRGFVQTDARGQYEIVTIRPGIYEERDTPAHLHLTVFTTVPPSAQRSTYIDDVMFDDDPILDQTYRARLEGRGGSGVVHAQRVRGDTVLVTRDILWDRIPGVSSRR
jgi:protocatechuate 3,4-dioxygenase, beta subunit